MPGLLAPAVAAPQHVLAILEVDQDHLAHPLPTGCLHVERSSGQPPRVAAPPQLGLPQTAGIRSSLRHCGSVSTGGPCFTRQLHSGQRGHQVRPQGQDAGLQVPQVSVNPLTLSGIPCFVCYTGLIEWEDNLKLAS